MQQWRLKKEAREIDLTPRHGAFGLSVGILLRRALFRPVSRRWWCTACGRLNGLALEDDRGKEMEFRQPFVEAQK